MATIQNDLRLFGLDLRHLGRDLRHAWHHLQRTPLLAWLTPEPMVLLVSIGGQHRVWWGGDPPRPGPAGAVRRARFRALELPQDLFLVREISLPQLPEDQLQAAVALEVQSTSPFAASQVVWGWRAQANGQGVQRVTVVMASRKQVEDFLQSSSALPANDGPQALRTLPPEVWAVPGAAQEAVVLRGFAETRRDAHVKVRRWLAYSLLILAAGLATAIAVTPTAQLRLRAIEAVRSYETLVQSTKELTQQREALLAATEQLKGLHDEAAAQVSALRVLEALNQALPDDSALQNFKFQSGKVTIVGLTSNATALVQLLGNQAGFRDVRAPSAATRTPGATKEAFTIEFTVDPQVFGVMLPPMPPAEVASAAQVSASADAGSAPVSASAPVASSAAVPVAAPPTPTPPVTPNGNAAGPSFGGMPTFGGAPTAPAKPAVPTDSQRKTKP